MATIEELQQQVAALSAQVAAITAPPTDYYTSQYSGEEIDQGVGRALPGGGIDASLSNNAADHLHRNLLDNWDFRNPVNQRNIASDTIWGNYQYGLDRWKCFSTPSIAWSSNGYITMKSGQQNCLIDQFLEGTLLSGMVCTLSALTDRKLHTVTGTVPFNTGTGEFSNISVNANGGETTVRFWKSAESRYPDEHVIAVKLELGDEQTLAHQDASGNWVLNEIPDYGEQLRRCQRYFQTFATESLRPTDALDFRPVMRANPALSTITVGGKTLYTASADL